MALPVPPFPARPAIGVNLGLGATMTATAGGVLRGSGGEVAALLEGDTAGVFSIVRLEIVAIQAPPWDAPHAGKSWQSVSEVEGAGPIDTGGPHTGIVVTVTCNCPDTTPSDEFDAVVQVVAAGTVSPSLLSIPVRAVVDKIGGIGMESTPDAPGPAGVLSGAITPFGLRLISTMHVDVPCLVACDPGPTFSSPTVPVTVPAGTTVTVLLPLTCAPLTPAGGVDTSFVLTRQDDGSLLFRLQCRVTVVEARATIVTTDLPQPLLLHPGVPVSGTITANQSGGTSAFTIDAPPLPTVAVTLGQQTVLVGGTGGNNLTALVPVTVTAAPNAVPGSPVGPLLITWSLPGDAGHASASGTVPVDLAIAAPAALTLEQDVVTPDGTALGGTVSITVRSDGSYSFSTHMHDSGLDPYSFVVRAVLRTAGGVQLVLQHSGSVAGGLDGGSSDDHTESGVSAWIGGNWADALTATMSVSKSYEDTVLGGIEDVLSAVLKFLVADVLLGPAMGVIIVLGDELTSAVGAPIGGPGVVPGVLVSAGLVWLFGPGMLFPALVAGVAAGAVTDALVQSKPMTDAERQFADTVFGGQVPFDKILLTNLSNGDRYFTWPNLDGSILVNVGGGFDDPMQPVLDAYPASGQALIHELTHAWQITHSAFAPGLVCNRVRDPSYAYGPPGPPFGAFTLEGQAELVDEWFGGNRADEVGPGAGDPRTAMDPNDAYYGYIEGNLRIGQP